MEEEEAAETEAPEEERSAREPVSAEGQYAEETPQNDELPGEDLGKAELAQMVRKKKEKASISWDGCCFCWQRSASLWRERGTLGSPV